MCNAKSWSKLSKVQFTLVQSPSLTNMLHMHCSIQLTTACHNTSRLQKTTIFFLLSYKQKTIKSTINNQQNCWHFLHVKPMKPPRRSTSLFDECLMINNSICIQSSASYYEFSDSVPTHLLSCCHSMAAEQLSEPLVTSGLGQAAASLQSRSAMVDTVHAHSQMLLDQIFVLLKWLNYHTHQQQIVIVLEKNEGEKDAIAK